MTSTKGKKYKTKKSKDLEQPRPQTKNIIKIILIFLKEIPSLRIWKLIGIISISLNFYFAYLAFQPRVTIDYASHIIPENPLALPIKINNLSLFSIHNVHIQIDEKLLTENHGILSNKYKNKLIDILHRNKSIDFIHNRSEIIIPNKPISGSLSVTLQYQLPLIRYTISEQQKFELFKSNDGDIYDGWLHNNIFASRSA